MKNIYLIPTDKPSKLYYSTSMYGYNLMLSEIPKPKSSEVKTINIYITSDSYINICDYVVVSCSEVNIEEVRFVTGYYNDQFLFDDKSQIHMDYCKKIIITTDEKLIKYGVQAIDDEFLQWFVNNSSCEEVKCNAYPFEVLISNFILKYKIIIPEEPNPFELPNVLPDDVFNKSLEELAEKEYPKLIIENPSCNGYNEPKHIDINEECRNAFMEGVKSDEAKEMWIKSKEAEKMYSEEDMRKMYDISCGNIGLAYLDDQTENNERFIYFLNKIKK